MFEYLKQPVFWISIIAVALIVNWAWGKFMMGKGKLI